MLNRRRRPEGVSLLELLIFCALVSLVLLGGSISLRGSRQRTGTQAVAERLAQDLRTARNQAVAQQTPTAVVLPDSHGQGYYFLEGHIRPKVIRSVGFSDEAPGIQLFLGHWPLATHQPHRGLELFQGRPHPLVPSNWEMPRPQDPAILFLPSGQARFEGPTFDDAVHLLVTAGLEYRPEPLQGFPSNRLLRAHAPITVSVASSGQVSVSRGVRDLAAGSVVLTEGLPDPGPRPIEAPVVGANTAPGDLRVEVFPAPLASTLPASIDATVKEGGFVSLVVEAADPDGDNLSCVWECRQEQGAFSSRWSEEMSWDPGTRRWKSTWEWSPPDGARFPEVYELSCRVEDGRGGSIRGQVGVSGRVQILPEGRIVYSVREAGILDLYSMKADGTDVHRLTRDAARDLSPRWSPDGSLICWHSDRGGGAMSLWVMNHDGTDPRRLAYGNDLGLSNMRDASFSPDGLRLAFVGYQGGQGSLYLVNVDGTTPSNPSATGPEPIPGVQFSGLASRQLCWSGVDRLIVSGGSAVEVVNGTYGTVTHHGCQLLEVTTAGATTALTSPGNMTTQPCLSPDGTMLAWRGSDGIRVANYSPGGLAQIRGPFGAQGNANEVPRWVGYDNSSLLTIGYPGNGRHLFLRNIEGSQISQVTPPGPLWYDSMDWVLR